MKRRVLVVCDGNVNRSPTIGKWLREHKPEWDVRDCGIYYGYPHQLNKELVEWAETIFVMETHQRNHLKFKYYREKGVKQLNIPDVYDRDSPELIKFCETLWGDKNGRT